MRKKVHRLFAVWSFDKEEAWLNEMAAKGLVLTAVSYGTYTFEQEKNEPYEIRLELLENLPSQEESRQYISFLEETGAEYIGSVIRWVYFRKKKEEGTFDLYSDYSSRIRHLNRILSFLLCLIIVNLANGLNMINLFLRTKQEELPLIIGAVSLTLVLFLSYGLLKVLFKKRKLRKENQLFE